MKEKQIATIKRILTYIKQYRFWVAASLILAVVTVATTLYAPILVGDGVDLIVDQGLVDFPGLLVILEKVAVVIAITGLSQWLMNHINNKITYRVVKDIRTKAFDRLEELPLSYVDSHRHGDIISRIIADIDQFSEGLLMGFTQLFTGVMTILGTLGFMLSVNPFITLVVVLLTPISLFVAAFIAKRTFSMFTLQSKTRGELTALVDEMLGNQKVVQAFGQEQEAQKRFEEINGRLKDCSLKAIFFSSITNPSTRFVNGLVYAAVGVAGAFAAVRGALSVGQLSVFLSYANQYTKPFNEISGVVTELQNAIASAARVFELIDEEAEPSEDGAGELGCAEGKVELEHVYFSYDPQVKLIEDLNLAGEAGTAGGHRRPHRVRKEHGDQPAHALLRREFRPDPGGRPGRALHHQEEPAGKLRDGAPGDLAQVRGPSGRISPTASRTPPTRRSSRRPRNPTPTASSAGCPRAMTL